MTFLLIIMALWIFRSCDRRPMRMCRTWKRIYEQAFEMHACYDNEWGFRGKMIDLTRHIDKVRKA